ncbi:MULTISPECIES: hypothetical protein [unclassified Streptomyces]|uniref:hypothetical protein n=1 Tax=unclassified Streptomyces TaxID=2593676 RepID=UPI001314DDFA|nr:MULTISPECIES: hypothetical protein [unclassified Streptomyces]MYR72566.1 hypothetical protein [Streptomyces sp. SID4925]
MPTPFRSTTPHFAASAATSGSPVPRRGPLGRLARLGPPLAPGVGHLDTQRVREPQQPHLDVAPTTWSAFVAYARRY